MRDLLPGSRSSSWLPRGSTKVIWTALAGLFLLFGASYFGSQGFKKTGSSSLLFSTGSGSSRSFHPFPAKIQRSSDRLKARSIYHERPDGSYPRNEGSSVLEVAGGRDSQRIRQALSEGDALEENVVATVTSEQDIRLAETEISCAVPMVREKLSQRHGCAVERNICVDLERFIISDARKHPGRKFKQGPLMELTAPLYNLPGFSDYVKGTKTTYEPPRFRISTKLDPPDIQKPQYSNCTNPLIWWPVWGNNVGDFFISSLAPLHLMQAEGLVDKNVKFVPVTDGRVLPLFYHLWLAPLTFHKVESFDEFSARPCVGSTASPPRHPRCFSHALLCEPHNFWHPRPSLQYNERWWSGLRPFSLGQEVARYWEDPSNIAAAVAAGIDFVPPSNAPPEPNGELGQGNQNHLQVTFIERKHKRRISNLEDLLEKCNSWQPSQQPGATVTCSTLLLDDPRQWVRQLPDIRKTNIMLGMHGAGLVNSYFLREGSSFVEIFPCRTGAEHIFASFREPHRIEGGVFGLSLFVRNESLCTQYQPEEYEQDRDALDWSVGAGIIEALRARDQDVALVWPVLEHAFERLVALHGNHDLYMSKLTHEPQYFDVFM